MEKIEKSNRKVLITGSKGFIAKNLIMELRNRGYKNLLLCNRNTALKELEKYIEECDTLVHLAGVNRPEHEEEYYTDNVGFTKKIIEILQRKHKKVYVIFSSTIQTTRHKGYGESKMEAERALQDFARDSGSRLSIFRLPNVFGKWCKPNYNSVVATFCYNVSHNLDIRVDDPNAQMRLVYIDDVVNQIISCMDFNEDMTSEYVEIPEFYLTTVGEVAKTIMSFKNGREHLELPNVANPLEKKLYSTYLSYMAPEDFRYSLKMNQDVRGSFTEFLHLKGLGQVSVNIAKAGITKGNHWHHTKVEKFLVVRGEAAVRFRHMITGDVLEYIVSGNNMEVIDIPVGYTHNITNIGTEDLITIIWANEVFDQGKPDTYYEEV